MSNSTLLYRQFLLRFIVPVAALVAVVLVASLAGIVAVANYQTNLALEQQALLAQNAITMRRERIEKVAVDYGAWDDAVDHLVTELDPVWADANIGEWTFNSLGFAMTFVVAPDDSSPYAAVDGKRSERPVASFLASDFDALVARQRAGPRDRTSSGMIIADGLPAIAVVAPIRYFTPGRDTGEPQTLLVFVDALRPELLAELGRTYLLPNLRILPGGASTEAEIPLKTAGGLSLGALGWDGQRLGDEVLKTALPLWFTLTTLFAVLALLMLRQARAAARMLEESERRATHDALTRLPNRVLFFERLDAAARAAAEGGPGFALLYLDLDGFKPVNDRHGHHAGDGVLRSVADRISGAVAQSDIVARLGGDEFAIILLSCADPSAIQAMGQKVIRAILPPISLGSGAEVRVGATIGAASAPGDGTDPLLLIRHADEALLLGKRRGKGHVRLYAALASQQAV